MIKTKLNYNLINEDSFPEMADILLNKCYLDINGSDYRLVEIEFYLKCHSHDDPYTHQDADQLLMHTFYFHKFKTGTYKSGTFKGMDLTFGNINENAYFGILVRSIQKILSGVITEGPCNVVNKILSEYHIDSIAELTKNQNLNIFQNDIGLVLKISDDLLQKQIYHGPRIGLSDKYPDYQMKRYRYATDRDKIKKKKTTLIEI